MRTYLFSYYFRGDEYGFEIPADSEGEAKLRLDAIKRSAVYDGVLGMKIPAVTGSWMPDVVVRFLNWMRG